MGKKAFVMFKLPGGSKAIIALNNIVDIYSSYAGTCRIYTVNDAQGTSGTEVQGSLEEILELLEGED